MSARGKYPASRPTVYFPDWEIFNRQRYIRSLLISHPVHQSDVEDLVNEVTFAAWRAMTQGRFHPDPEKPIKEQIDAWIAGIVRNQAGHYRSRAHRRHEIPVGSSTSIIITAQSPLQEIIARNLLKVLETLPPECLDVVLLSMVGMDGGEIAKELGLPRGTVATRLRRGRRLLQRRMRP